LRGPDQPVDQVEVAVATQSHEHTGVCLASLELKRIGHPLYALRTDLGKSLSPSGEPLEQDVGVTSGAEFAAEPAKFGAQASRPLTVENRPERPQIRAQSTGCHARLVHSFDIGVQPNDRVTAQQANHPIARA
jgi:hypothetical protein